MIWDTMVFSELESMLRDRAALSEFGATDGGYRHSFPLFNGYESKDDFILTAFVPGIARDNLDIRFEDGSVTLKGGRGLPVSEGPDRTYLRQERAHGEFEKLFRFPVKVVQAGISAKLENGVLVIRAPKAEEAKPKQIAIQG